MEVKSVEGSGDQTTARLALDASVRVIDERVITIENLKRQNPGR